MPKDIAPDLRHLIDHNTYADEAATVAMLREQAALSPADRGEIGDRAANLVTQIRGSTKPGMMEVFLAEYGLPARGRPVMRLRRENWEAPFEEAVL